MSLKDALDGCERILHDEFKDYPESALYMIGAIDEAKKRPARRKMTPKPAPNQQPEVAMHLKFSCPSKSSSMRPTSRGSSRRPARARSVCCRSGSIAWRRSRLASSLTKPKPKARYFVAVDEGVLVKTGPDVLVSVRRAIGGRISVNCAHRWRRNF